MKGSCLGPDVYSGANFSTGLESGTIRRMTSPGLPIRHEQRKIEQLLIALAKKKPVSAKPAPIAHSQSVTGTSHPRVFFST